MANTGNKIVQVYIPVVMSDVIHSNGISEDIDFYIERLFLAYNVNTFSKFAGYTGEDYWKAATATLLAIGTAFSIYKNYWSVKKTKQDYYGKENNGNTIKSSVPTVTSDNKNTKNKASNVKINSTNMVEESLFLNEDMKTFLSNPSEVLIKQTLIKFKAVNFMNKSDISDFRKANNQVSTFVKRVVSKLTSKSINVVTNDIFYVYSSSEVSKDDVKKIMESSKNSNVVVVDTVNNLVTAVMRNKGAIITNTIKLSVLTNERHNSADEETLDKVIKGLKSIKVGRL